MITIIIFIGGMFDFYHEGNKIENYTLKSNISDSQHFIQCDAKFVSFLFEYYMNTVVGGNPTRGSC